MKRKIAVVYGGFSSEHDISVKSGKYIASILDRELFDVYRVHLTREQWLVDDRFPVDKRDFSFKTDTGNKIRFDLALIIIHGAPGEDGKLQGYFDLLGIPYVSCDQLRAALTFNKYYCNHFLHDFGVNIAESVLIRPDDPINPKEIVQRLGLPVFVKPNAGGSSLGTTKVKDIMELLPAIDRARAESEEVLIEQYVKGREITVGVLQYEGRIKVLTPCEVRSKREFFDYQAKYDPQLNEEIIPAPISGQQMQNVMALAERIYQVLGCQGIVRLDFILSQADGRFYFLELNSIPGMTSASIVPKMLKYDGLDITKVFTQMILKRLKHRA